MRPWHIWNNSNGMDTQTVSHREDLWKAAKKEMTKWFGCFTPMVTTRNQEPSARKRLPCCSGKWTAFDKCSRISPHTNTHTHHYHSHADGLEAAMQGRDRLSGSGPGGFNLFCSRTLRHACQNDDTGNRAWLAGKSGSDSSGFRQTQETHSVAAEWASFKK